MNMEQTDKITRESFAGFMVAVRRTFADAWAHYRGPFIAIIGVSALLSAAPYAVSGIQAFLINRLVESAESRLWTTPLTWGLAGLGVLFYLRSYLGSLNSYLERHHWMKMRSDYERRLSAKLLSLDMATHEDRTFRDKLAVIREHGSSHVVANFLFSIASDVGVIASVLIATVAIISADWKIFLIILVGSLPRLYIELRYGQGLWSIYESTAENRRHYSEVQRHTWDETSIREIQTLGAGSFILDRQKNLLDEFLALEQGKERSRFLRLAVARVLVVATLVLGASLLIAQVVRGTMQVGTFTFFLGAMISFQATVEGFFHSFAKQHRQSKPVKSLFEVFDRAPIIISLEDAHRLKLERSPRIEFRNVSFAYPSRPDTLILNNFSLTIEPGEHIALVGENGEGKSTLIKLLCRLYDPTDGVILVDGVDLREMHLPSWYDHLALLAQDYSTFRFKTREAINLGRVNGTVKHEKIVDAARKSQAQQFIEKWEDKYEQQLGVGFKGGVELSGGQRQRLALARTFFRDAHFIMLDEPGAHLDPWAEQELFRMMEEGLREDQTLFLVTHRLSTVRKVDRICVLKEGTVHEIGSHDELMGKGGEYYKLFEAQAEAYR